MSELDNIVDTLRKIAAKDFASKIASRAATGIQASLKKTLAAGTSPEGKMWAPKKEGGRPYANAASKVSTSAHGEYIRVVLTGGEVYGHYGTSGMPVRQMIPDAGAAIPASISDAITKAASEVLREATK